MRCSVYTISFEALPGQLEKIKRAVKINAFKTLQSALFIGTASVCCIFLPTRAEAASQCDEAHGVRAVTVAEILGVESSCALEKFHFSFRKPKTVQTSSILYFGGGPNAATLGTNPFPIPDDFGLLRFDYPGMGCNEHLISCREWSSESIAELALATMKRLGRRNYIIYGVSYGTVPATIATAVAERDPLWQAPRLLLLESVIGRAYLPGEVLNNYKEEWSKVLNAASASVRTRLQQPNAFGCSPEAWGAWIERGLNIAAGPGHGHVVEELLKQLGTSGAEVGFCAPQGMETVSEAARKLYTQLVCREISPTAPDHPSSFVLRGLALKPLAGNLCRAIPFDRKFDAAQWPIRHAPIGYISGMRDPATPPEQAQYHQQKQDEADRIVVDVLEGGHNPLAISLSDCAEDLFTAFTQSSIAVKQRLEKCAQSSRFTVLRGRH